MILGLNTPTFNPNLVKSLNEASRTFYGDDFRAKHEGGSIPFLNQLLNRFP